MGIKKMAEIFSVKLIRIVSIDEVNKINREQLKLYEGCSEYRW